MTRWTIFQEKLSNYARSGQQICFWWREDDVSYDCDKLHIVLDILSKYNICVLCGVIPKLITQNMILLLKNYPNAIVCQHGLFHKNNYTPDYKCEFDTVESLNQIIQAREFLKKTFQNQFIPVYIPPWNNISKQFKDIMINSGWAAVSTWNYSPDKKRPYNCDIDFINWAKSENFGGEDFVTNQILQCFDRKDFNIGLVNHHRTIGIDGINFIEKLLSEINKYPNIVWKLPF